MARAKKAYRRRARTRRRRRYYRKRRFARKYRRRTRRFPRSTEVKSISKAFRTFREPENGPGENENATIVYEPGFVTIIGAGEEDLHSMVINQGTSMSTRVGAKLEPLKLRISGSILLESSNVLMVNNAPNFWQVRCIVYQIKGGNASHEPDSNDYHQLAMQTQDGDISPSQVRKLLMTYWNDGNVNDDISRYTYSQWLRNNLLGKIPMRRGIGGLCRVLYKKTFWINTQKNPIKQFRFVTRTPKRFVYPETTTRGDDNNTSGVCNNAVYILWLFQPGSWDRVSIPRLSLTYNVDFFFTDK